MDIKNTYLKYVNAFIITTIAVCGLYVLGVFKSIETHTLDLRFLIRGSQESKIPLYIVAIDDMSLKKIGHLPWPRNVHARLIEKVQKAGVKCIVYNILFDGVDRYNKRNDTVLSKMIRERQNVVLPFYYGPTNSLRIEVDSRSSQPVVKRDPVPILASASNSIGFITAGRVDTDGHMRQAPLHFWGGANEYYALGVLGVTVAQSKLPKDILSDSIMQTADFYGYPAKDATINFRGPLCQVYQTIPFYQLLDDRFPIELLKDKIILIGMTAGGTYDHYPTAFSRSDPGVYIQANIMDNLWANDFLRPINRSITLIFVLLLGVGTGILTTIMKPVHIFVAIPAVLLVYWALAIFFFSNQQVILAVVAPTMAIILNLSVVIFLRYRNEIENR